MGLITHRDQSIDIARGIAIIAIVLGHVLRGLGSAGIVDDESEVFLTADRFFYAFHLPVFAFVGGLFLGSAVERDGTRTYLWRRNSLFIYLYVVWSLLQGAVRLLTSSVVNEPTSPLEVLSLWLPEGQLWFLPFLVVVTTAAALARGWRSPQAAALSVLIAAVVSVAVWGLNGSYAGTQGLGLAVFFFAGAALGAKRFIAFNRRESSTGALAIGLLSTGAFVALTTLTPLTPPTSDGGDRDAVTVGLGVAASCLGVVAVLAIAKLLALGNERMRWLSFIGERSLEIFLAHIIAGSGTRIVLALAGVSDPTVHIVVGTLAGVVLPLILWSLMRRLRFPWLFDIPRRQKVAALR
ncbi:acyltransferase [Salinibacterium sp. ZJ454]|uniref:acyltransferase family protein n=1 Tax=Salinibacterium sp. ZJ454 TaxID=2708339 RepID=UPI00141EEDF1|nr:acyltransferase [Salinibacterium sp. ZJ454]